jgi:regulator of nonsense transcripts 1
MTPDCGDPRASRADAIILDRLPVPLGMFISKNVYDGNLHSNHKIVDHSCIAFVDVQKGTETKQGNSYRAGVHPGAGCH